MKYEEKLAEKLRPLGVELAVAESCSGGLLASKITDVPGSSDYFIGSLVAYSNRIKKEMLDVQPSTLRNYGAVSRGTAEEMAEGVLDKYRVDYSISTTGIAGPTGGTEKKPVGLVYLGFAQKGGKTKSFREVWEGDRLENKEKTAERGLKILLQEVPDG